MKQLSVIICLTTCLLATVTCNEEEDSLPPVITITAPADNESFFLPDTVKVTAEVTDETNISVVEVSLLDDQNVPVASGGFFYPDTTNFDVISYLDLSDKSIESGTYRIKVTASDYYNITNSYREIFLNEVPRSLIGYIAVTASLPFETRIRRLSPDLVLDTVYTIPEGFLLSSVHSLWEQFYLITPEPSMMRSLSTVTFEDLWEFPAQLPRPYFTEIISGDQLFFSTANGDAGILNESGQIILRTTVQEGYTMDCMAVSDQYLFAEVVSLSGSYRFFNVYYRSSGQLRIQKNLADDIKIIFAEDEKAIIFTESEGHNGIDVFDPEEMVMTNLTSYAPQLILSGLEFSPGEFLICTDQQVLRYDYQANSLSVYLPRTFSHGRYDPLSDVLFFISGSQLERFRGATSASLGTLGFDEPVLDFQIVYNK